MELLKKVLATTKAFANEAVRSAYDLTWYRDVRRSHKLASSVRYLLVFQAFIILFYAGVALSLLLPVSRTFLGEFRKQVPDGTFFEIKDGKFDTNLPEEWSIREDGDFLLDTDLSLEGINPPDLTEKSWIILGREAIFVRDDRGIRTVMYRDLDDFRMDKEQAVAWIDEKLPGIMAIFSVLGVLFGYAVSVFMYAVFIGVASFAAFGLSRILKVNISLDRWLVMGPRMVTLPILVTTFLWIMGVTLPFGFSLIYLMMILAVLFDERNNPLAEERPAVAEGIGKSGPDAAPGGGSAPKGPEGDGGK